MSFIQELFTSRNNGVASDDFVGKQGRIWWDPSSNGFYYSDGVTPGGIPIGTGTPESYGEFANETFIATPNQTAFTLTNAPSGVVSAAINGATVPSSAITNIGVDLTYIPEQNGDYELQSGDEITIGYLYGTVRSSTLSGLGDVHLGNTQGGQVLMYDGSKNMWVAGNPNGALQNGIQNDTTLVRISQPGGPINYKISGVVDKVVMSTQGINITDGEYRVNGNLAVNGPTIKIENKNSTSSFDSCDRPVVVPYQQSIPVNTPTRIEYSRLCWDTVSRFNPTNSNITIGGVTIQPWSWRPLVPGYYQVVAQAVLTSTDGPLLPNIMNTNQFVVTAGQTEFTIDAVPQGSVIFVVNGAVIADSAISIDDITVTYDPVENEGYELINGDEVAIYYVTGAANSGSSGSSRLAIQVDGSAVVNGSRQTLIGDEFTIDVNGILLLTPDNNVSVSVLNSTSSTLNVIYSMLSATMVRGV